MFRFIRTHVEEADRLGEVLFGLIMALGFTASARIGLEEADNRDLFVSILGCNVAWAIVDGVMFVLTGLFEKSRRARLVREIRSSSSDTVAIGHVAGELDGLLAGVTTADHRAELYRNVVGFLRSGSEATERLGIGDLRGGAAVALLIVLATLPVVTPFLLGLDAALAVRLSNAIAIAMLFLLGVRWARIVGASPLGIGSGLMTIGVVLVAITIALGG